MSRVSELRVGGSKNVGLRIAGSEIVVLRRERSKIVEVRAEMAQYPCVVSLWNFSRLG